MKAYELPWWDAEEAAEARLEALEEEVERLTAGAEQAIIGVFGRDLESIDVASPDLSVVDCCGHPRRSRASEQPRLLSGVPFLV